MTTLWTTPREWLTKDAITKERLNAISDNLTYLHTPSSSIKTVRGTGADAPITSLTPIQIDDALFTASLETTGRVLNVNFLMTMANATAGAYTHIDVLMDGVTYLSSLTGTQLTYGLLRDRQSGAAYVHALSFDIKIPAGTITAGAHVFVPRVWVSGSTSTFYLSAGYFAQFGVRE